MTSKRAHVAVLWVSVAVAAAVLASQAMPARPSNAQTGRFGSVRPATPPLQVPTPKTFPAFALAGGVTLHLPLAKGARALFHESSSSSALPMGPYGQLQRNANPTRFTPQPTPAPGMPYSVMASRGRGTAATSAVDIAAPAGATLYSPVTGRVVALRAYWLYGRFPDIRMEIEPEGYHGIRVVIIHLEREVHVGLGDRVVASQTPIGRPRVLPFTSQTDTYTHTHDPHVHLEVKRA